MKSVMDMDRDEFIAALSDKTTPQDILDNANIIYTYLSRIFNENCMDSVLREWAFQWSTEQLNINYDVIYDKWLSSVTL